jgi:hypothetical protein
MTEIEATSKVLIQVGLVAELCGAFLLAATGFGAAGRRGNWFYRIVRGNSSIAWGVAFTGVIVSVFCTIAIFRFGQWFFLLWGISIFLFTSLIPILAVASNESLGGVGHDATDDHICELHVRAVLLLGLGFALQGLGTILQ